MLLNYSFPWGALYDGDEAARWADIEKELRFQKDHGMNSVAVDGLHVPVSDDDTAQWEKFIDLYQKVAFDQPIYFAATMNMYGKFKDLLDPKQQDEYCAVLKKLETVARKRNQKVFYSLCDETTNDGREAIAELVATFTKAKVPEIARIGDINGYRELTRCAPYLNAAGFNNGWQGSFGTNRQNHDLINRTVIERVKAVGCEPWFVNGGVGRYPFGVFFWKMESLGVRGKCEWHYYASTSDPYNPLDSNQPNAFGSLVFPTCIPTLQMEDSRQGIDDLRYVRTLQQIVSAAKGKDMPRLQADRIQVAKEALDFWLDQLPDKMITAHTSDGAAVYTGSDFPPARMAEFRSEMAWHLARILKLDCPALCPSETRIASWEKDERTGWTSKIQSVAEHATDGSQSGKMVFDKPGVYFDTWGAMKPKDWRGYSSFRFDIFNPQDKEISLVMVVRDQLAACVNAEASARKTVTFKLKSGNNPLSLSLADLTDDAGKRSLDMTCIFNIYFNVKDAAEGTTLFVDNMRLVQNE